MGEVLVDAVGIDSQSKNFEEVHATLQAAIGNIDDEVASLVPSLWDGLAAKAFVNLMTRYQEKAQRQQTLLMEASGLLKDSSTQLAANDEASEARVAAAGSSLSLPPI
ncbi:WXG100 family type VII secretion target [Nocardia caishijiensis]|uniref:ESAT-6-like protein n=1 Tax=Nocardia caishijiensis TaxID=184756 RepID=A0ABQ6YR75_9NOCA|nr:WXG100 family type VII secretion target [Nocardia caishijiensis]KAF0848327.1 WXG100 family type VII secretion target [Nocardia caishijiensis]